MKRLFLPLMGAIFVAASSYAEPLTLLDALSAARQNRASIQAARLKLEAAQTSRRGAGALPATQLAVGYTTDPEVGGTDDDLVLSQAFDLFGRGSAARAAADASILAARAELTQAEAELQFEVATLFNEAVAAAALETTARQGADIAQQLYDAIKSLVDEGRLPGVQLTRVGIERDRALLKGAQRHAEWEAAMRRLRGVAGLTGDETMVTSFQPIPDGRETRRADLLLRDADVRLAEAAVHSVSAMYRPEFEVQARRTAWQESDARYGLRFQVNIPLVDHGRARAETGAARTMLEASRQALRDAERLADAEKAAARIELDAAGQQIEGYLRVKDAAEKLVEQSRAGFTERAVTLIELLEATRALREVEEGEIEARLRLARANVEYLRASGIILEVGR